MKLKNLITAAAVTCLTSTFAYAQDAQPTGLYAGANAGVAMLNDLDVTYYDAGGTLGGTGGQDTLAGELDFKKGPTFGGVVGYDLGMLRTDLEFSFARNKLRSFTAERLNGAAINLTPGDRQNACNALGLCAGSGNTFEVDGGRVRQLNGMANAWIDLPLGGLTPYAGGGVGFSNFKIEGEDKTRFAWQLGAGAALQLSRALAVTADYRHREARRTNVEFDAVSGLRFGKPKTDTVTLGLRAYFGGRTAEPVREYAPPPAAPVPEYTPPPPVYTPPPAPAPRPGERG
jgi:opacity protein-like surface antigen